MAVLAYHFIFSAYGFWLPNDPRGSWSSTVRAFNIQRHGDATKIETPASVAAVDHDRQQRFAAKQSLKYPPVKFTGEQARAIARGFTAATKEHPYRIHALAIMPDHVHVVMAYYHRHIDKIATHLKAKATMQMNKEHLNPMASFAESERVPTPWARRHWCPYISSVRQLRIAVRYVRANPVKSGLKPQRWNLVRPLQ